MLNDEVLFSFHGLYSTKLIFGLPRTYYLGEIAITVPPVGQPANYYLITALEVTTNNEADIIASGALLLTEDTTPSISEVISNKKTLVFDEAAQQFSSFYSAVPPIYIENGNILMSPNPAERETVFTHNKGNYGEFYGTISEAYLKLVINPNADINKILRFIEFASTVRNNDKTVDREKTITAFRVETEYQDTNKTAFSPDRIKRRFDKWRLKIPRDQLSTSRKGRLRSTHFILTLYYDNTYNKELILNRLMSHYDIQVY